jgi:hypothetical protein
MVSSAGTGSQDAMLSYIFANDSLLSLPHPNLVWQSVSWSTHWWNIHGTRLGFQICLMFHGMSSIVCGNQRVVLTVQPCSYVDLSGSGAICCGCHPFQSLGEKNLLWTTPSSSVLPLHPVTHASFTFLCYWGSFSCIPNIITKGVSSERISGALFF